MAFSIEDVVDVSITLGDRPISTQSFDIPMILVAHNVWTDRTRIYTDADDLLADGFASGSPIYKMVSDLFSGIKPPQQVVIGRRELTDYRATFDVANSTAYTVALTVNTGASTFNKTFTYTSDADATGTEIAAGLASLIEADADINSFVAASNTTSTLIVAPSSTGKVSMGAVTSNVTVSSTSAETVATAIAAITAENDQWFFLMSPSHTSVDVQALAEYASANKKIYFTSSQESAIFTSSSIDIASVLNGLQYDNVVLFAHKSADKEFVEAAALGSVASSIPGNGDLYAKTLVGAPIDTTLTATEANFAKGKNANIYIKRGGVGWVEDGKVSSGRFFDVIHGALWAEARLQEDIFGEIKRVSDLGKMIRYTNAGIRQLVSVMKVRLDEAVRNSFLASYEIFPPKVEDIATNDKANRYLPDIPFEAILGGGIHTVKINGYVRV